MLSVFFLFNKLTWTDTAVSIFEKYLAEQKKKNDDKINKATYSRQINCVNHDCLTATRNIIVEEEFRELQQQQQHKIFSNTKQHR